MNFIAVMKNLKNGKKSEVINMQPTEKFDLVVSFDGNIKQQNLGDICRIEEIELALKKQGEFFYIKETEFHNILLIELNLPRSLRLHLSGVQLTKID